MISLFRRSVWTRSMTAKAHTEVNRILSRVQRTDGSAAFARNARCGSCRHGPDFKPMHSNRTGPNKLFGAMALTTRATGSASHASHSGSCKNRIAADIPRCGATSLLAGFGLRDCQRRRRDGKLIRHLQSGLLRGRRYRLDCRNAGNTDRRLGRRRNDMLDIPCPRSG